MHCTRVLAVLTTIVAAAASPTRAKTTADIRAQFDKPGRDYSSGPLWVWNDMLTEEQVRSTLRDLADQHVKQAWVHPRPGLMTPYLSDEWIRLWKVALDEAEKLDMNIWIYDENSYPSGFAGGFVPDAMPESRGRGLAVSKTDSPPKADAGFLTVHRQSDNGVENITAQVREGGELPQSTYYTATIQRAGTSPWYGGKFYVDLIYPGVTEKFLEITLEPYRKAFADQFGKRVPGSFTDEPQLRPAGGMPWTDDLPEVFEKRWGYSLLDHIPSLTNPVGDYKRIRHNYFSTLNHLFIERWARPYYDYCEKNHLEFTGHYWEHEWPNCIGVPDNMAMYAWHQRPAIDTLMNRYAEDTHAQFGNARAVRELASVANQMGRARTLCEAYGAGGWDLRFEDMKRIGDWLYVLGVNTLNEHLSYITVRGARKRDHPQSFSYHTPWWPDYHVMADYFTRLSLVMSAGQQHNDIVVIEPTTTAWFYQADPAAAEQLKALGDRFQSMIMSLEAAQVEYDLVSEDVLARHASTEGGTLRVGKCDYRTVVLPEGTENLDESTFRLLDKYGRQGGVLLCCGDLPGRIDGVQSDAPARLADAKNFRRLSAAELPAELLKVMPKGLRILRDGGDKGILFHHRRTLDDGSFLFLVNTSITDPSSGRIVTNARGVEQWDLNTGQIARYPFVRDAGNVTARYELPPCGSLMLCLADSRTPPMRQRARSITTIDPVGPTSVRRLEDNVLVLDCVTVTAGGQTKANTYFYQANQFAFARNGMERNPWDSAVQFREELITRTFPGDSGLEATYTFSIEQQIPETLDIVIERPDLYTITCNGKAVEAQADRWWLDRAFGRIDIRSLAQVGDNTITLKASPFTIYHELESAYVLGDFRLKPANSGFVIIPDAPLEVGHAWNANGHPFYAAGVAYTEVFDIERPRGRYIVELPKWSGSVARVTVNGRLVGRIVSQPWQLDVTDAIGYDRNTIEVTVVGTLKNTLGPHHIGPTAGAAWPHMFQQGPETGPPPGEKYDTLPYGLFEPFTLRNSVASRRQPQL